MANPLPQPPPRFWVAVVSPLGKWFHGPLPQDQAQAYLADVQAAGNSAALVPSLSN